jgi:hypothetical protein
MKQYEAVIKVMEANGGYATLGNLYQHVLKITNCDWKTKTPYASIRRIVQDERFFFKIQPGLWALNSYRDIVLNKFGINESSSQKKKEEFNHSYYQGLIVEIGNMKGFQTFVPYQDKNKKYLSKGLSNYTSLRTFYDFTYAHLVKRAITIDVTWFNERNYPHSFFEIEHTTDIQNSLLKFADMQDFYVKLFIVSAVDRKNEFQRIIGYSAFRDIQDRVHFIDYDYVSQLHTKTFELYEFQKSGLEV